jgi:glycosyltransferase involved in cell wall biosynthesis
MSPTRTSGGTRTFGGGPGQLDRRGPAPRLQHFGPSEFGVHQILAAASPGDAITNAALEYRDVLRRVGPSEIFARHIAPSSAGEVRPLSDYRSCGSQGVLVYHASIGEPMVEAFLRSRYEPIVLVYHNITPARYFERLDDTFAELLVLGRAELESIRPRVARAIAASQFNAAELEALGYQDVRVVHPVVDPERLVRTAPDPAMVTYLDHAFREPLLLFVGQLLPHKRPDLLVEAMHVAVTYYGVRSTMLLVGQNRFARYADAISAQVRELNLQQVHIVGSVSDAQLAAMFRRAAAFVTVSEHEGFCVPLLEAMAFDVPVVARACAAIPETVGDGGLLLPPWAGPELVAETIARLLDDEPLRSDLAARGRRRLAELTAVDASVAMLETIAEVV